MVKNNLINNYDLTYKRNLMNIILLISLFIMVISILPSASAVAIGVNKAKLDFKDVLRGGYAEDSFVVSTDSSQIITGSTELIGSISDWVDIEPKVFNFSASKPATIKVIMKPSSDAANGDYKDTYIRVITGEIARSEGGKMGTSARAAFKINLFLGITGVEKKSCVIGGVRLKNTEIDQPIDFLYSVKNNGNVRVQPKLSVKLYSQDQELKDSFLVNTKEEVLPTTSKNFLEQLRNKLSTGQYWAEVYSSDCSGGGFVTFDVLERGGVSDEGELVRIDLNPWANVSDVIPIYAVFKNKGSRTVSAKFKGTIMRGKKLVKVIDTDFYNTPPGEIAKIETFFNPTEPGQYVIKGRVLYNNKLTFDRSAILNVNGHSIIKNSNWGIIIIILVIIILLLLIIIKKKKKNKW